jgi:hypothetical protein
MRSLSNDGKLSLSIKIVRSQCNSRLRLDRVTESQTPDELMEVFQIQKPPSFDHELFEISNRICA